MLLLHTNLNSFRWVLVFARCLTLVKFLFLNWCLLHKFGFSCRCRRSIQGSSICEVGETIGAATLCDIYNPINYSSVLSNLKKTLKDYTSINILIQYALPKTNCGSFMMDDVAIKCCVRPDFSWHRICLLENSGGISKAATKKFREMQAIQLTNWASKKGVQRLLQVASRLWSFS